MKAALGKVTREADGFQVRFEREFRHSIDKVWQAITDPEKLKYWFTDIDLELKAGGKMTVYFRDKDKSSSQGKIIAVEKPHRFVWTWEHEQAVWELFSEGANRCRVILTYSKLEENFAEKAPAGFHLLLDRLADALEGSQKIHPFGTEEGMPEFRPIQEMYEKAVFADYPELLRKKPIVVEKSVKAPVERVWKALTDKDQMKQWFFDLSAFRPEVGFEFLFAGKGQKGQEYMHRCKIAGVVPLKKLAFTWAYEGYPGESIVTFELTSLENTTMVKLTHEGLASFPADQPDFDRSSFNAGWNELVGKLLPQFVEKETATQNNNK
jgi:uncharacterized protein YndB with AHSA1/START domain